MERNDNGTEEIEKFPEIRSKFESSVGKHLRKCYHSGNPEFTESKGRALSE